MDQLTRELLAIWGSLDEQVRKQLLDFARFKAGAPEPKPQAEKPKSG